MVSDELLALVSNRVKPETVFLPVFLTPRDASRHTSTKQIVEHIATIETRNSVLEAELGTVAQQSTRHESQLTDMQWKMEDFENQQLRNNLHILGIQEGAECQYARTFIIKVFKTAFPELISWDLEKEIQRAHRFPMHLKKQRLAGDAHG
ncbi:hypothetical protein NDU88_002704 [Pleurodeles waltl]|uniref:Uncharacterized protein n=1 Tax=Pleurodeles waltl TaxID=8319 RepID=A0AAV7PET7_PLEWA|nr:hypothetical protein NDU88_002704 [Pleurodeles waltl]